MEPILNTLYAMTQGSYLHLDHDTIKVEIENETKLQVPLIHLGGAVLFGNILISPFLIHRMAEDGRSVVFMSMNGRFKGRITGPVSGNVLLRKEQYAWAEDNGRKLAVSKMIVAGKTQNLRGLVVRAARESNKSDDSESLKKTSNELASMLSRLEKTEDIDETRGVEGIVSQIYYSTFNHMIKANNDDFTFSGRNRRPPRDRVNALLSFLYTMLANDCASAAEGVGLDPQVGFLHSIRPGRNSLALDLMEEFRSILADRLALSLINLKQLTASNFIVKPGGGVFLNDEGRKTVVIAYQKRKQEEMSHPFVKRKVPLGLVLHLQARLMARHIRGDMESYAPFIPR